MHQNDAASESESVSASSNESENEDEEEMDDVALGEEGPVNSQVATRSSTAHLLGVTRGLLMPSEYPFFTRLFYD